MSKINNINYYEQNPVKKHRKKALYFCSDIYSSSKNIIDFETGKTYSEKDLIDFCIQFADAENNSKKLLKTVIKLTRANKNQNELIKKIADNIKPELKKHKKELYLHCFEKKPSYQIYSNLNRENLIKDDQVKSRLLNKLMKTALKNNQNDSIYINLCTEAYVNVLFKQKEFDLIENCCKTSLNLLVKDFEKSIEPAEKKNHYGPFFAYMNNIAECLASLNRLERAKNRQLQHDPNNKKYILYRKINDNLILNYDDFKNELQIDLLKRKYGYSQEFLETNRITFAKKATTSIKENFGEYTVEKLLNKL